MVQEPHGTAAAPGGAGQRGAAVAFSHTGTGNGFFTREVNAFLPRLQLAG